MRKKTVYGIVAWIMVVLWMGVIYCFSAQTGEESGALSGGMSQWIASVFTPGWKGMSVAEQEVVLQTWRFFIRKGAHMTEFAVMGALFVNAWVQTGWQRLRNIVTISAACALLVAIGDEIHQMFVPARGPSVRDVFIDFFGAMTGIGLVCMAFWLRKRLPAKKK